LQISDCTLNDGGHFGADSFGESPVAFGGPERGNNYRNQLVGLIQEVSHQLPLHESGFWSQVDPEQGLVCFFVHDSELGDEIRFRPSSTGRPVVGRSTRAALDQLVPDHLRRLRPGEGVHQTNAPQSELPKSFSQFIWVHCSTPGETERFRGYPSAMPNLKSAI
jgi:hypothetical protein